MSELQVAEKNQMKRIQIERYLSAIDVPNPHLIAIKLQRHLGKKVILSIHDEGWDLVENGFELLLLEMCNEIGFCTDDIVIETANPCQSLTHFRHLYTGFNGDAALLNPVLKETELPVNFNYGQFYARPSNERLYSFYKHLCSPYKNRGIASMHLDIMKLPEHSPDYREFIIFRNNEWNQIKNVLPYSDIGQYIQPPIVHTYHNDQNFWKDTYNKIAIEIVNETNQAGNGFFMTEKTLRPMLYGRLFLIIANPGFELKLKKLGFDIFDDVIDKTYDNLESYWRIDHLYAVLDGMLTNYDLGWFETLIPRLEKNKKLANDLILESKEKRIKWLKNNG